MRGLKSTLALAAVLIGLVAYIYFVDRKKPASDAPEVKDYVFHIDAKSKDITTEPKPIKLTVKAK